MKRGKLARKYSRKCSKKNKKRRSRKVKTKKGGYKLHGSPLDHPGITNAHRPLSLENSQYNSDNFANVNLIENSPINLKAILHKM